MEKWRDDRQALRCAEAIDRIQRKGSENEVELVIFAKNLREAATELRRAPEGDAADLVARFYERRGESLITIEAVINALHAEADNLTNLGMLGAKEGDAKRGKDFCMYWHRAVLALDSDDEHCRVA